MEQESGSGKEVEKSKRTRIEMKVGKLVEADPDEFIPNSATPHGKKIHENPLNYIFEIWFDKHLHNRQQHGDDNGPREGIEKENILLLIEQILPHVVYYSLNIPTFSVLELNKRLCLKNNPNDGSEILNVIIQINTKEFSRNKYEITVITAMCVNDFRIKDNQYIVQISEDSSSILKHFSRGRINEVCVNENFS